MLICCGHFSRHLSQAAHMDALPLGFCLSSFSFSPKNRLLRTGSVGGVQLGFEDAGLVAWLWM